jgi:hypothetical protein
MSMVTPEEKANMMRLLQIMEGQTPTPMSTTRSNTTSPSAPVELAGPGVPTRQDISAMADVLRRLNTVTTQVLAESHSDPQLKEALETMPTPQGVRIGAWQIQENTDSDRLVNKHNWSVINKYSNDVIAHELGLYEAALALVKMLNKGMYINSQPVRELLEAEAAYTSHKMDALRFRKLAHKANKSGNPVNMDLYEARQQSSMDKAMAAKAKIRKAMGGI